MILTTAAFVVTLRGTQAETVQTGGAVELERPRVDDTLRRIERLTGQRGGPERARSREAAGGSEVAHGWGEVFHLEQIRGHGDARITSNPGENKRA